MTRFIFVTGGVVSSLGKGIAAASLGAILESRNLKVTMMKLDPYLNVDPGTMSPYQHGEVYVTSDGAETDLDLGHYERFVRMNATRKNSQTTGRIYERVIRRERKGDYEGRTVQVIPHITNEIKSCIRQAAGDADIMIVEIGGTVGDIESLPYLEAIRQFGVEQGREQALFIHLTLVPYLKVSGEIKTKPTQHSTKELRSIGIQPDILICRSEVQIPDEEQQKISLFTNVAKEAVITCMDADTIYRLPMMLHEQGLDRVVLDRMRLSAPPAQLQEWQTVVDRLKKAKRSKKIVHVAMVGKYVELPDAYKSVNEALLHAGIHHLAEIKIHYIDSGSLEMHDEAGQAMYDDAHVETLLANMDAILVPGGFGERGIEGKINAARFAREHKIPYLGICLGLQVAVIEYARNVCGLLDAHTTEIEKGTATPIIALITEWASYEGNIEKRSESSDLGGTMRLGAQGCRLEKGSKVASIYNKEHVIERHRHRYEFNNDYLDILKKSGLVFSGWSDVNDLVEFIEIPDHPWFVACQAHPEFTSNPRDGHPLFSSFIEAALECKQKH